jgi:16S rRNA processing protein RimM
LYLKKRQIWTTITIVNGHKQGKGVVAQLEGINDRDQAFTLIGMELGIQREQLSALADDHYYWTDLEGLKVVTTDNVPLGKIAWLFETGSNDVMVVKGEQEYLIPWIQGGIVKSVDLNNAVVCVEWDVDF